MKIVIFMLLALLANTVYADQTGSGKIEMLQSAYGGWIFNIGHTNNNPSNCSKPTMILVNHAQQDQIYSLILAAYSIGKPVTVYTNGCHSNGYNTVTGIYTRWSEP